MKLVDADNYQQWLAGLRIAAATQPGVADILFTANIAVQQPPNPKDFFFTTSTYAPLEVAPFQPLGNVSSSDVLKAYDIIVNGYQVNQAQLARARELLLSSVDHLIVPLIADKLREGDHPKDAVAFLDALFSCQNIGNVQTAAILANDRREFPNAHHNMFSSILRYLGPCLQDRATYNSVANNGLMDHTDADWCKRIIDGLTDEWRILADGLLPSTATNLTRLLRFLLQWDRNFVCASHKTEGESEEIIASAQATDFAARLERAKRTNPQTLTPPRALATDDFDKPWILDLGPAHISTEPRWFTMGITPNEPGDPEPEVHARPLVVVGAGDAHLGIFSTSFEHATFVLKSCLYTPDQGLAHSRISLPALLEDGYTWELDGDVMKVVDKRGRVWLTAEIGVQYGTKQWVVTNIAGPSQLNLGG
ncbi:uncharacterized protein AB675_2410 [Cyphellophora attinorum]|uniref:Uncharacterized protein n=1 Tax=Cyphellophora attinorum TaxID=1664694 RepID=A0A0N0NRK8_9EURO|nr:uncharacterized protein AB675_2410 [Phialophora attinorum]KPI45198.1 hypothetical protein AB675_2410 [Phialophora attinorum]